MTAFHGVGVVLVEYRSGGLTAAVARTAVGLGCHVVVGDNSGTYDGPGTVVELGGNAGFGAACNAAVERLPAEVDVVVLWNPDATVPADGLEQLVGAVRRGWGAVAPALATPHLRRHGFAYPSPLREAALVLREVRGRRRVQPVPPSTPLEPGGVMERTGRFGSAALLAVDRRAFASVGGFDERWFLYGEDLDLWDRLGTAGHRCGFLPSVVAEHRSATGSDAPAARRAVLRWVGVELFAATRGQRGQAWYRGVHRIGGSLLRARDADPVVADLCQGIAEGASPEELSRRARREAVAR